MHQPGKLLASEIPTILPVLAAGHRRVLDLGCGAGGTLLALGLPDEAVLVGVDVDFDALRLSRQRNGKMRFVCANAESLAFREGYFDLVISKVALPYMNIPVALKEVYCVLCDGGQFWMTLHPFRMATMRVFQGLMAFDIREVVYQTYAIVNGLTLAWTGRQFRFPANRRRCESIQTVRSMTRALCAAGFCNVQLEFRKRAYATAQRMYGSLFAVTAWKPAPPT